MRWRPILLWLVGGCAMALCVWGLMRAFALVSVAGGSMVPALLPADIAVVRRGHEVERGQIALLASATGSLFLHRVVGVSADGSLVTRGDANGVTDFAPTPKERVVGPVVLVVPAGTVLERWRRTDAYATLTAQ